MLTLLCDRLHNDRIMEADAGTPGPRAQTAGRIATGNSPGFKGRFYHQKVHGSIQQVESLGCEARFGRIPSGCVIIHSIPPARR